MDINGGETVSGVHEPLGAYRYDVASDSWWWSGELYEIYGFAPGGVVPTSKLLWEHTHPGDREAATELISTALGMGGTFSLRHRIIDTRSQVHTVVSLGAAMTDSAGTVTALAGYVVDITAEQSNWRRDGHDGTAGFDGPHRVVIEQAKGALRAGYGCTSDEAFALLKWRSQRDNKKIYVIADQLLASLTPPLLHRNTASFDGFTAGLRAVRALPHQQVTTE